MKGNITVVDTNAHPPLKNAAVGAKGTHYHNEGEQPFFGQTSQIKVEPKTYIKLCSTTRNELAWLLKQYGESVPTWLRKKFVINQFRRKALNKAFCESQLDVTHCERLSPEDDWSTYLHLAWHQINGVELCK